MLFLVHIDYYPENLKDACLLAIARYHFHSQFDEGEEADFWYIINQLPDDLKEDVFEFDSTYYRNHYLIRDCSKNILQYHGRLQ